MSSKTSETGTKPKKSPFLVILTLKGLFLVPLILITVILFSLMVRSEFYVSILKNAGLIESFIQAKNWQMEEAIKNEIEKKVKLEEFRLKYDSLRSDYETKKKNYENLNRSTEYKALKEKYDELDDLSFKRAPGVFAGEDEFDKYKEDELKKLKKKIREIEDYRDRKEDSIEKAEDTYRESLSAWEDAKEKLEDKEEDARDIVKSHKGSFMGKIYADIGTITPVLTEELNSRLIEVAVKREIEKLITFMSTYSDQKRLGNVYTDRLSIARGKVGAARKVKLPPIIISLWVEEEVHGIRQKRHLLSQVFVDRIKKMEGLNQKASFIKIFKFSETGLAERIGRKYLKKSGITLKNGIIKINPIILEGSSARAFETAMLVVTHGMYVRYILLGVVVLLLIFIFFTGADKERKKRALRRILLWPSSLVVLASLGAVIFSGTFTSFFPDLIKDPVVQSYAKQMALVVSLHLFLPLIISFALIALTGSFIGKKKKVSTHENKK